MKNIPLIIESVLNEAPNTDLELKKIAKTLYKMVKAVERTGVPLYVSLRNLDGTNGYINNKKPPKNLDGITMSLMIERDMLLIMLRLKPDLPAQTLRLLKIADIVIKIGKEFGTPVDVKQGEVKKIGNDEVREYIVKLKEESKRTSTILSREQFLQRAIEQMEPAQQKAFILTMLPAGSKMSVSKKPNRLSVIRMPSTADIPEQFEKIPAPNKRSRPRLKLKGTDLMFVSGKETDKLPSDYKELPGEGKGVEIPKKVPATVLTGGGVSVKQKHRVEPEDIFKSMPTTGGGSSFPKAWDKKSNSSDQKSVNNVDSNDKNTASKKSGGLFDKIKSWGKAFADKFRSDDSKSVKKDDDPVKYDKKSGAPIGRDSNKRKPPIPPNPPKKAKIKYID